MGQQHRRLVAASCCIWLLTAVALRGQDAPDVAELRSLAAEGDAKAQFNLGAMYADGQGLPQDDSEAVRWYRRAADQGYAAAQYNLGGAYVNGRGVPQDYGEAVRWYRHAADQGLGTGEPRQVNRISVLIERPCPGLGGHG